MDSRFSFSSALKLFVVITLFDAQIYTMWLVESLLSQLLCLFDISLFCLLIFSCFLASGMLHWLCAFLAPEMELAMSVESQIHCSTSNLALQGALDSVTSTFSLKFWSHKYFISKVFLIPLFYFIFFNF